MDDLSFCFLTIRAIPLRRNSFNAPTTVCAAKRRLKCAQNFARTQELPCKSRFATGERPDAARTTQDLPNFNAKFRSSAESKTSVSSGSTQASSTKSISDFSTQSNSRAHSMEPGEKSGRRFMGDFPKDKCHVPAVGSSCNAHPHTGHSFTRRKREAGGAGEWTGKSDKDGVFGGTPFVSPQLLLERQVGGSSSDSHEITPREKKKGVADDEEEKSGEEKIIGNLCKNESTAVKVVSTTLRLESTSDEDGIALSPKRFQRNGNEKDLRAFMERKIGRLSGPRVIEKRDHEGSMSVLIGYDEMMSADSSSDCGNGDEKEEEIFFHHPPARTVSNSGELDYFRLINHDEDEDVDYECCEGQHCFTSDDLAFNALMEKEQEQEEEERQLCLPAIETIYNEQGIMVVRDQDEEKPWTDEIDEEEVSVEIIADGGAGVEAGHEEKGDGGEIKKDGKKEKQGNVKNLTFNFNYTHNKPVCPSLKKRKKKKKPGREKNDDPSRKSFLLEPRAAVPRFPHPAAPSTAPPIGEVVVIGRRARLPDLGHLVKRKVRETAETAVEDDKTGRGYGKDPIMPLMNISLIKIMASTKKVVPKRENTDNINLEGPAGTYATFAYLRYKGKREPLPNRDKVATLLQELEHTVLIPICKRFGLRYHFFGEAHCQAKKAGMTIKEPLIMKKEVPGSEGETVTEIRGHQTTIRIRVRVHPSKGDPKTTFMNGGTLRAVLLHEIAHLRVMNHGKNFMLFLREVFQYAAEQIGVFKDHPPNEIPSPWPWENMIYETLGKVSDDELIPVFEAHRAAERAKLAKEQEENEAKAETKENEVKQEEAEEDIEPTKIELMPSETVETLMKRSMTDFAAITDQNNTVDTEELEEETAARLPYFLIEALLAMNNVSTHKEEPDREEQGNESSDRSSYNEDLPNMENSILSHRVDVVEKAKTEDGDVTTAEKALKKDGDIMM